MKIVQQRWLFACFLLCYCIPGLSASEWLGLGGEGIDRLYYLVKNHENFPLENVEENNTPRSEELLSIPARTEWGEIFIDLQNKKMLVKIYPAENKPSPAGRPAQIEKIEANHKLQKTVIWEEKKRVRYEELTEWQWKSAPQGVYQSIFAGKFFMGEPLPFLIKEASESLKVNPEQDARSFSHTFIATQSLAGVSLIREATAGDAEPNIVNVQDNAVPVKIFLDKANLPIKISGKLGTFSFKWHEVESPKYLYVSYFSLDRKVKNILVRTEQCVKEIKVNPAFPADLFDIPIPEDFSRKDTRKLLTPPQF